MPAARSAAATPSDGSDAVAGPDERHGVPHRAVGIERRTGCGRAARRRRPARRTAERRPSARRRPARSSAKPASGSARRSRRMRRRRSRRRAGSRCRPLLTESTSALSDSAPDKRRAAEVEAALRVRLGEVDVVGDQLRRRARQIVDQQRVHDARPRPAAGVRLQIAKRVLVDLDERDVLARGVGPRRPRQPPVVGLELDGLAAGEGRCPARVRRTRDPPPARAAAAPRPTRRPATLSRAEYNRCPERDCLEALAEGGRDSCSRSAPPARSRWPRIASTRSRTRRPS